jgi:hypothetical protein
MPDELCVDEATGIIKVRSYGVVSRDDVEASMNSTREIMEQKGIKKVIVDTLDQEAMPGITDIFALFSTLPGDLRAALLVRKNQATSDGQRFAETVSLNRGIQVRIFQSEEEALPWLNE